MVKYSKAYFKDHFFFKERKSKTFGTLTTSTTYQSVSLSKLKLTMQIDYLSYQSIFFPILPSLL
ncbi:hypothetical protein LguiA_030857 [Lonicera macranthoides]